MIFKNVAGQGVYLFAYDTTNSVAKTGDAANITGKITKDGAASGSTATGNPTEIGGGIYWQPLSQAETNASTLALYWSSTTSGIQIDPLIVMTESGVLPNAGAGVNGGLPLVGSQVPNATAGNANGLLIAGTNAATTIVGLQVGASGFSVTGTTSFNNTGQTTAMPATDGSGAALATHADATAIQTAVGNLNNLSALANLFGPSVMVRPAAGSIAYALTLTIRDSEGHLVDADATPALAATNAAGTDRSANFSAVTHASTGVYTATYTIHSTDPDEGIRSNATCAVGGSSRRADLNWSVADADNLAALAAIQAKTDQLTFDGSGYVNTHAKVVDDKTGYSLTSGEEAAIGAAVWANGSRTLSAFNFALTTTVGGYAVGQDPETRLAASASYLAAVAGAVWAALTSGMTAVGSIGLKLASWVLGSDHKVVLSSDETGAGLTAIPGSSPAAIATAVWSTALPGSFGNGTAGALLAGVGISANPWAATTPEGVQYGAAFNEIYAVMVPAKRVDNADHSQTQLWRQGANLTAAPQITSEQSQTTQTVTVN